MGYAFHYPSYATIYEGGAEGMDVNEIIPPGFTYDQYFDYVLAILPDKLCVTLQAPGIWITITPPYDLVGRYIGPCPGMGIGSQYNFEEASLSISVAGHKYIGVIGTRLYLESTGAFYGEFYRLALPNDFRVTLNSRPAEGMSNETYLARRAQAIEIISTLHWFRTPGFAKLGTTCAGSYTRLLPGVFAQVAGKADDPPNRVRSGPGTDNDIVFQIYPGTVVKILEGPVCADGLVFWKVKSDLNSGAIGWTAEGDMTTYWIEPFKP
jgi:hypothetical protein